MGAIETKLGRIGHARAGSVGARDPIVFLHGVGSDKSVWAPQMEHFAQSRLSVAFDMPGYAESGPARVEGHAGFAAALLSAMDGLGVERAHLCGLSLGGVVALAMAHAAPERIASLVLADSFAVHPEGQAIHDRSLAASRELGMRGLAEARVDMLLGSRPPEGLREAVVETMARIEPGAYATALAAVWLADQRARLSSVSAPTLVLCGDEDRITPPALSRDLADGIANARLETIAGAGHLANAERFREFNAVVEDFLSKSANKA